MDDLSSPIPSGTELVLKKPPRKPRPSEIAAKKAKAAAKKKPKAPAKKRFKKQGPKPKAKKKAARTIAPARSVRLDLRLTPKEKAAMVKIAKKADMTLTHLLLKTLKIR